MIARIDHVNLVVADLEGMIAFYTNVLGLNLTRRVTISGEWIAAVVGLSDVHGDVAYLDFPSGPRVEMIRYNRPAASRPAEVDRANTPGIRHLAFTVDDIDATAGKLRAAGVRLFSDVQTVPDSQVSYAGGVRKRLVYFADPEGNLLELCEYKS